MVLNIEVKRDKFNSDDERMKYREFIGDIMKDARAWGFEVSLIEDLRQ